MLKFWFSKYAEMLKTTKLVAQGTSFLLTGISLLSLYDLWNALRYADDGSNTSNRRNILVAITFHLLLAGFFAMRFCLLWKAQETRVWLAQLVWALGVTTIYFYAYSTGRVLGLTAESYQNCMDCFYYQTFLYASESFTLVFLFYPMIAIFKELSVVFTAFVQVLVERHTNSHV